MYYDPKKPKALLRPQEVSDRLGCGLTKFWEIVKSGALDVRYLGGSTRVTEESVDAYIDSLPKSKAA